MEFIIVLVFPIVHFILEAFHDYHVWKASNANEYEHTVTWHLIDFISKTAIYLLISLLAFSLSAEMLIYLVYAGCMRIVFLNGMFNTLRDDPVYYFSPDSNFIDEILGETPQLSYYGTATIGLVAMFLLIFIEVL